MFKTLPVFLFAVTLGLAPPLAGQELFPLDLPAQVQQDRDILAPLMQEGNWQAALPVQQRIAAAVQAAGGPVHIRALRENTIYLRLLDNTGQTEAALDGALAQWHRVTENYAPYAPQRMEPGLLVAELLAKSGRTAEALPIALEIARNSEQGLGAQSSLTALARFQAVQVLDRMGYLDEAVVAYADLIAALQRDGSEDALGIAAGVAVRRGFALSRLGDYAGAAVEYATADRLNSRVKGALHPETIASRRLLARALFDIEDMPGMKAILDTNFTAVEQVFGADSVEYADWQRLQARWEQVAGQGPEVAVPIMRAAVARMEARLPEGDRFLAEAQRDLAGLLSFVGAFDEAYAAYQKSEAGLPPNRKLALDLIGYMEDQGQLDARAMADQVVPVLQDTAWGRARGAVDEQTKRAMLSSDASRALYRQISDLAERRAVVEADLSDLATRPKANGDPARETALRGELAQIASQSRDLTQSLTESDPAFAGIAGLVDLDIPAIQALLSEDEVFVIIDHQRHDEEWSYAVAVTHDRAMARKFWVPVADLTGWVNDIRASVSLRLGVRGAAALEGAAPERPEDFPYQAAWRVYENSFLHVWELFDDKPHVLVDLRGPMTGLPPALLLAYEPRPEETLETAPFLVRMKSLTVLPSVSGLRVAALSRERAAAPKAFAGFADPVYDADAAGALLLADAGGQPATLLRGALAPLPETAQEVAQVRAAVAGTDPARIWQGLGATEAAVKSADLDAYRMLYFATHGLVAGDRAGTTLLTEPALALTPGAGEDGFLTASEIARMRLNADWVVLSACNTAVGEVPGAEALSGLAQAFLYAGARGMLVSHWPVESRSAVQLMTDTFRIRAESPDLPAAEAQARAMLAMLEGPNPAWHHPAFWAPFVLVGRPD
ncbi:CHAT domain-containing protein [Pseudotabrizicola sp. L79]|uniref:CHAT domain-containing protein n=1 Tax=Pseudotabrizicola sp. L79 TaxID=3118402 RepID=UPI002F9244A7